MRRTHHNWHSISGVVICWTESSSAELRMKLLFGVNYLLNFHVIPKQITSSLKIQSFFSSFVPYDCHCRSSWIVQRYNFRISTLFPKCLTCTFCDHTIRASKWRLNYGENDVFIPKNDISLQSMRKMCAPHTFMRIIAWIFICHTCPWWFQWVGCAANNRDFFRIFPFP